MVFHSIFKVKRQLVTWSFCAAGKLGPAWFGFGFFSEKIIQKTNVESQSFVQMFSQTLSWFCLREFLLNPEQLSQVMLAV